jgi:hypothetical protein
MQERVENCGNTSAFSLRLGEIIYGDNKETQK